MQDFARRNSWVPMVSGLVVVFGPGVAPLILILALDALVAVLILQAIGEVWRRRSARPGPQTLAARLRLDGPPRSWLARRLGLPDPARRVLVTRSDPIPSGLA